jgi:hypothetical protein
MIISTLHFPCPLNKLINFISGGTVLDLQKKLKQKYRDIPFTPSPIPPIINNLHYYGTFIAVDEPIAIYYY